MRFYLGIILLFLAFGVQAKFVQFAGKVKNAENDKFFLYKTINALTQEEAKFTGTIKEDETFNMAIEIEYSQIIRFEYNSVSFNIFVRPFDSKVELSFDTDDVLSSLVFMGECQANNNFLKAYHKSYGSKDKLVPFTKGFLTTYFDENTVSRAKAYGIEDFFDVIKREKGYKEDYLKRTSGISPELRSYLRKEMEWEHESAKFSYFIYNSDRIKPNSLSDYWVNYRLLQGVDINDKYSLKYPVFQNLLSAFIHYLNLENPVEVNSGKDLHYYRFIKRNLTGKVQSFMQAKLMLNAFRMGEPQLAQQKFKEYKRYNRIPEYTKTLEDWFGKNLQYVAKETIPDFKFLNANGLEQFVTDFRGKVVYISLWASWCQPCLEGFRNTDATRRSLANQGVVMLNVNLDKTEHIWRKTQEKLNLPGTNVYGLDLSDLQKKMEFDTLPFYLLVDKYGRQSYLSSTDLNQSMIDFHELMKQ